MNFILTREHLKGHGAVLWHKRSTARERGDGMAVGNRRTQTITMQGQQNVFKLIMLRLPVFGFH